MTAQPIVQLAERSAWSVYLEYQEVFKQVLIATGPWEVNDGLDVVHDFLAYRLSNALLSYDPEIGPMRPWLYTVFSNFAKRRRLEKAALQKRWTPLDGHNEPTVNPPDNVEHRMVDSAVASALQQLPGDSCRILVAYFREDAGNVRAVARRFKYSRHTAKHKIFLAIGDLISRLEGQDALTTEDVTICRSYFVLNESWTEIAQRLQKPTTEVQSLLRDAVETIGQSLARLTAPTSVNN